MATKIKRRKLFTSRTIPGTRIDTTGYYTPKATGSVANKYSIKSRRKPPGRQRTGDIGNMIKDHIKNTALNAASGYLHEAGTEALKKCVNSVNDFVKTKNIEIGLTVGGNHQPEGQTTLSAEHSEKPYHAHGIRTGAVHHIKCTTGAPTTKSLKAVAKNFSVVSETIYDTKTQSLDTPEIARFRLDNGNGFNQRSFFFLPSQAATTVQNVLDRSSVAIGDSKSEGFDQKTLLSLLSTSTEITLMNQSVYFPLYVKIHMIQVPQVDPDEIWLDQVINHVFHLDPNDIGTDTAQDNKKVPTFFQHSAVRTDSLAPANFKLGLVDMSLKGKGLAMSAWFRANCKIAKTFSKTLQPGDQLQFRNRHHYGNGLDIYSMLADSLNTQARTTPLSYYFVIETKGAPTELVYNKAGDFQTFLGTSPSYYMTEFRSRMTYVSDRTRSSDISSIGVTTSPTFMHQRSYTVDQNLAEESVSREFFLPLSRVVSSTAPADTFGYVPVVTDSSKVGATQTGVG